MIIFAISCGLIVGAEIIYLYTTQIKKNIKNNCSIYSESE